ncbi:MULTISPECIES: hypothetical protein [Massilia]|jgi:hypothetical protein|uniref:hypothetical protein n=1 Tax=Massilia TaxID=149698 RepID=UPI0004E2AA7B|nr:MULTISPECIES: hypothetical protein [Massilia]KFC73294.1 hypothetical protein FG94_01573 [Massilia sp. LC238]
MASPFLREVPTWGYIAFAVLFTLPVSIPVVNMVQARLEFERCTSAAAEWETDTGNGRLFAQANTGHYGVLYASYKKACPNGSFLVDESRVPAAIKNAADNLVQK